MRPVFLVAKLAVLVHVLCCKWEVKGHEVDKNKKL